MNVPTNPQGISPGVRMLMQRMQPNNAQNRLRTPGAPGAPGARMVQPQRMAPQQMPQENMQRSNLPPSRVAPPQPGIHMPPDLQQRLSVFAR